MIDLWPVTLKNIVEEKSPVTLLKEQATLLGEKTDNIVKGKVVAREDIDIMASAMNSLVDNPLNPNKSRYIKPSINHDFSLVAPILNFYTYHLFAIKNGLKLYPVTIYDVDRQIRVALPESEDESWVAQNEDEFLDLLRKIFNSDQTISVIRSLLSQSA